jgi:type III pantothenate kinase
MLLTIDAGNTRTKWAVFSAEGEITQQGACANIDFPSKILPLHNITSVMISNVAGEVHANQISSVFASKNLALQWFKSSAQCCDVTNHYTQPETLGTDRWAAIIAAWHLMHAPCVVVNAGTAVTIDALMNSPSNSSQGEFIGGIILPGLTLMQSSLGSATAQLPYSTDPACLTGDSFSTFTASAIANGAIHAICGAIEKMQFAATEKYSSAPHIILSGGDAATIAEHLREAVTNQLLIVDNLVLTGLYLCERSQHQKSDKQ